MTDTSIATLRARGAARAQVRQDHGTVLWAILSQWKSDATLGNPYSAEHLAYQLSLERDGRLFAAGPLTGESSVRYGGLIVVRAPSREEAERMAVEDPYHSNGVRTFTLFQWTLNEGQMTVTIRLGAGEGDVE